MFEGRFAGKTVIITGGASGLGEAVAVRIKKEGGKVALWDLNEAALHDVQEKIGADYIHALDIADSEAVASAMSATVSALGKLDILVNSAGITGATVPVHEFPVESWQRVIDINLNGLFYACREAVPHMLDNGYGRIINVASVAGKEGNPNASAYSASKAGVIGFTKSLGKELATKNVLVNCITPAAFESPIFEQMPESHIDYMRSKIPMGRLGLAEENAAMVCFLASDECSFSTAATFDTSGGRSTF